MGLETFESLGIRMVIDLRTSDEIKNRLQISLPQGVDWQNIALEDTVLGNALLKLPWREIPAILNLISSSCIYEGFYISNVQQYKELLPLVMSSDNRPIDIHCQLGASRTGLTVALIQLILGVTEVGVMDDFLLTNEITAWDIQENVESFRQIFFRQNRAKTNRGG